MSSKSPENKVNETSETTVPIQGQNDATTNRLLLARFMDIPTLLRYKNNADSTVWDSLDFEGCKADVLDKLFPKIDGKGTLKPPEKFRSSAAKIKAWRNMTREEQGNNSHSKYKAKKAKEKEDDPNTHLMAKDMDIPTLLRHKNDPDSTVWDSLCFDGCTMACFNEIFPKVFCRGDLKPPERYRTSAAMVEAWRNMTKRQQHDDNLQYKAKEAKEERKRKRQNQIVQCAINKKSKCLTGQAASRKDPNNISEGDDGDGDESDDGDGLALSPRKLAKRIQDLYKSLKNEPNWEESFMNSLEIKRLIFLYARYHKITDGIFLGQKLHCRGVSAEYLYCRPCSSYSRDDGTASESCKLTKITKRRNDNDSVDCDACRKINERIRKSIAKKESPNPKKTKAKDLSRKQLKEKLKRAVKDHENTKYKLEEARNSLSNGIEKNGAAKTTGMDVDDNSSARDDKEDGGEIDESSILRDVAKYIKSNHNQGDDASKKLLECLVKSIGEMDDGGGAAAAAAAALTYTDHDEFISETLESIKDYVAGIRNESAATAADNNNSS